MLAEVLPTTTTSSPPPPTATDANHISDHEPASTAASPPSVDEEQRRDDQGVSPDGPPTVGDLDPDDRLRMDDDTSNGGLEPQAELATEPIDGEDFQETQVPVDAMDIDVGITIDQPSSSFPDTTSTDGTPLPVNAELAVASTPTPIATCPTPPSDPLPLAFAESARASFPADDGMHIDTPKSAKVHLADGEAGEEGEERPAKRARSDNQDAPVASSAMPSSSSAPAVLATKSFDTAAAFSPAQVKYALSVVKNLRKHKEAIPFLKPVDPVELNIPHYPTIVTHPMDLGTIEQKLNATKKGAQSDFAPYRSVDEFTADVQQVWNNAYAFNGPQHVVSQMAKSLEDIFAKQIRQIPPPEDVKPVVPRAAVSPVPAAPAPVKKAPPVRRPSTTGATPRRSDDHLNVNQRPKREIHAPPPKDLSYPDPIAKSGGYGASSSGVVRKAKSPRDDGTAEQLKFCEKIVNSMFLKQYANWAYFFYDPVDATIVPNYYQVIKKPMDLSTIRRKVQQGEYSDANKFYKDFQQIIKNCFQFNPEGSVVRTAGEKLQHTFEEKWAALPPLRPVDSSDEDDFDDGDDASDIEKEKLIRELETQVAGLNKSIDVLKSSLRDKRKRREKAREERQAARYAKASSSKADRDPTYGTKPKGRTSSVSGSSQPKANGYSQASSSKPQNKGPGKPKKVKHESSVAPEDEYDEIDSILDNVQKKELSEEIEKLDQKKLEKVIQIIQEGVPGIANNSEEIELEIDALPAVVLQRLYNFVVRPLKQASKPIPAYKIPKRTGSGNTGRTGAAATGGVKRKSMDEAAEAEKIRQLEEKARILAGGAPSAPPPGPGMGNGADEDDSVQSSEESGSESESDSD